MTCKSPVGSHTTHSLDGIVAHPQASGLLGEQLNKPKETNLVSLFYKNVVDVDNAFSFRLLQSTELRIDHDVGHTLFSVVNDPGHGTAGLVEVAELLFEPFAPKSILRRILGFVNQNIFQMLTGEFAG